ncbi:MAG TPA: tetratricopeptide repeat protein [Thermoguttaceae bacterium]|nr:tetratricopeptide repeat protein [Thermoguttaceae bacterium]
MKPSRTVRLVSPSIAFVLTWALAIVGTPVATAAEDDLAEARRLLLSGKYAEAAEIYRRAASEDPAATLGLARSLVAEGKSEEAVQTLTSGPGEHAELHAELARLAFERGDHAAAETHVDAAIRLDAHQLLARWVRGELFRTSGRLKEAEEAYLWVIRFYNEHQREIRRAESLRWIGLAAARYARWNRLSDQFQFLVKELYPDALKIEPDYWPAHYELGRLFLEKYNQADAAAELSAALELNPNAAEVHVALSRLALQNREVDKAQTSLERALQINPNLPSIHLVLADLEWANFRPEEAIRTLDEQALRLNPVSEEALGRLAACYVLLDGLPEEGGETRFARLVEQVTARNEHAGGFFYTLADWLRARHKIPEAERFYQEAIRRMPQLVGPRAELGMMSMDAGEEAKARGLLEAAFEADPFNVRVDNMLKVLDLLDEMATRKTEHCVVKFDAERDELLARYAARHLDAVYPELCDLFGYVPPQPPLVEVFNRAHGVGGQQWFGTRLIGLPYLGTVAASTGRIVGMVSPSEPDLPLEFNWAQTLKHELVHVITLQQTHFNIPHWYTEGLAVWSEGCPRPQRWNELLVRRASKGGLFDLETINFAFTRPNSSDDWHLAYCQAELYVEHMLRGRSEDVLRRLLSAYADNLTTSEAIPRVFGVSEAEFERGYLEYVKGIVAGLAASSGPQAGSFAELLRAHGENPDDVDLCARVAYGYLGRGALDEALNAADRALEHDPKHQLATYVVARLQAQAGRTEQAIAILEACLNREAPDPRALNLLAGLKLKTEKTAEAAQLYQLGAEHDLYNLRWPRALARVYLVSGDDERLAEILARLADADPDDLATRKKLAELALARQDFAAAADWANRALEIAVTDAEIHRVFAEASLGRHNFGEAIREFRAAIELGDETPPLRTGLARAYLEAGQPAEARQVLEELLRLDPNHSEAGALLEQLEEKDEL